MFRGHSPSLVLLIDDYWPRRRASQRMPRVSKAALSIGLSLPDGHLVRNAAWFP
jgi:hypothetical protein